MRRALQLAQHGLGTTRPNPSVGCVIVHNNTVIAEGYTSPYGGPHAEVNAINAVEDESLLLESTLYVTLEPCSHHGQTPPCSDLIVKKHIPNVVIGTLDPNEKVAGRGIKKLESAGRNVTIGVLEEACKTHHRRFLTFQVKKRPYIILKWAQTADGFIAPQADTRTKAEPVWITNAYSRQLVHKWRSQEHAILVGANTVLADNPSLTTRHWAGDSPIRIVLDKKGQIDHTYRVMSNDSKTLVIKEGNPHRILEELHTHHIQSVIIEGGAKTLQLFINAGLWDEARVFTGTISFGNGIAAPQFEGKKLSEETIVKDTLTYYQNA